jgi:hypothetical protein
MALPSLFGARKAIQETYFLSLYITEELVQAAVWGIKQSQIDIISRSQPHRYTNQKEAIAKTDLALQELSEKSEQTNKVVFGFDASWIRQTSVTDDHKNLVKSITTELNLEPLGFVSTSESLVQQLISEQPRLSAVVLFFHQDLVSLFLLRNGKLTAYVDSARSEDVIADVREGLQRLVKQADSDDYLPSQMLLVRASLFDEQLTTQQPKLMAYDFSQEQRFVETPVMEVLQPDTVLEAVTKQGGLAVAKLNGLVVTTAHTRSFQMDGSQSSADGSEMDVVTDQSPEEISPVDQDQPTSFGVPITTTTQVTDFGLEDDSEFMPIIVKNRPSPKRVMLVGALIGLVTVLVGGLMAIWLLYQVKVQLVVATMSITDDVQITLDPAVAASDPEQLILKADIVSEQVSDSITQETTGVKLVGEKARGTVVLYNKTNSAKTFAKDTRLQANTLQFTLDEDVEVASASVSEISGGDGEKREYGKKEVSVTAVAIGAQGNIDKDSSLKVASFDTSTYTATAKESFAGGSSREVRVVSADDQQKLQKDLLEVLTKKAAAAFKQDSVDGTYIIPTGRLKTEEATYSATVGKEADNVSLEMTVNFEGVAYAREDVKPLVLRVLGDQVQEGYQLVDAEPEILSSPTKIATSSARIVLDANVSSKIKPIVTSETVRDALLGKTYAQAIDHLKQRNEFETITVTYTPPFIRQLFSQIPTQPNRVLVEIVED